MSPSPRKGTSQPARHPADAIVRAINEAKAVMLVMSESAVASSHVGREIERAASKHKQIIAFRIDAAPSNHALEYFLSVSQWIDVPKLHTARPPSHHAARSST
jgi:TIR domain